jgi:beta-galactosidase
LRASLLVLALALAIPAPPPPVVPGAAPSESRYGSFLFGVDYYPEAWPEGYWEDDARRMREAGVTAVRMAEFAWYLMEPQEGTYDFRLFERAIAVMARHGIKTILGTPTAAPPKWLTHKYPETLAVFSNGRPVNDQTRRHTCFNSPVYRQMSKKIVEAMAGHFKDNPHVIGWQTDNEFNCHIAECYSESCRRAFRTWARGRYGDLDSLNRRWGTGVWSQWYTDWEQLDLPFPGPAQQNPGLMLDYKRFLSDSVVSYQKDQIDILRRVRPRDFITHNQFFKNINYYDLTRDLDIFSVDTYPSFIEVPQYPIGAGHTLARDFNGRFMVMEMQTGSGGQDYLLTGARPGQQSLWAFQAIAHGADGMVHFRWRTARRGAEEYWDGVIDHDNVGRWKWEEFKKEGLQLARLGPELLGSRVLSDVAVIKDYDGEWVYDYQYLTREVNVGSAFTHLFQAASEKKYNIDFVSPQADLTRYKVVFGPYLVLMDPDLAGRITRFVEGGGVFVASAHVAAKDRDNGMTDQTPPLFLADLFGAKRQEYFVYQQPSRDHNALRFDARTAIPVSVMTEMLQPTTADVIATWDRDYQKGRPAVTENRAGRGKAVYYGSFFNLEAARYLLDRYAREQKVQPIVTGVPTGVEVTRRSKGDVDYYFLLNHSADAVAVSPGAGYDDALEGRPAPAGFSLKPYEYRVLKRGRPGR